MALLLLGYAPCMCGSTCWSLVDGIEQSSVHHGNDGEVGE